MASKQKRDRKKISAELQIEEEFSIEDSIELYDGYDSEADNAIRESLRNAEDYFQTLQDQLDGAKGEYYSSHLLDMGDEPFDIEYCRKYRLRAAKELEKVEKDLYVFFKKFTAEFFDYLGGKTAEMHFHVTKGSNPFIVFSPGSENKTLTEILEG